MGELVKGTQLSSIECHFKWAPVEGDIDAEPDKGIPHMIVNLNSYPSISGTLVLIGYLHTKLNPPEYDEALKKFNDVLENEPAPLESPEEHRGYKIVALGNKIHTLMAMGDTKAAKILISKVDKFENLPDKTRASILAQHAFALTFFGPSKFKKSVELYKDAFSLDRESYAVLYGAVFAIGRLRRFEEKSPSSPSKEEILYCFEAVKISKWKLSSPIVLLADLMFAKGRPHPKLGIKGDKGYFNKSKELFRKAYELDPHSSNVLMRCGKAFHYFGEKELGIRCLKEAVKLDQYSSSSLFRLGQCLARHWDDKEKLREAEKYLYDAVTVGRRRHFFAEIELGKVRKNLDKNFDLKRYYENIKIYYVDDPDEIKIIDEEIKNFEKKFSFKKPKNGRSIRSGCQKKNYNFSFPSRDK